MPPSPATRATQECKEEAHPCSGEDSQEALLSRGAGRWGVGSPGQGSLQGGAEEEVLLTGVAEGRSGGASRGNDRMGRVQDLRGCPGCRREPGSSTEEECGWSWRDPAWGCWGIGIEGAWEGQFYY